LKAEFFSNVIDLFILRMLQESDLMRLEFSTSGQDENQKRQKVANFFK
jgi:hypothetical protein